MSEHNEHKANSTSGPSWKVIASASWVVIFGLGAWNLKTTMDLKVEMARVEQRLNMNADQLDLAKPPAKVAQNVAAGPIP